MIHETTKVLKVLYVLVVLLIIKTTIELLFMAVVPQMTYSVKINRDERGKVTSKAETNQKTVPLLHRFSNAQ